MKSPITALAGPGLLDASRAAPRRLCSVRSEGQLDNVFAAADTTRQSVGHDSLGRRAESDGRRARSAVIPNIRIEWFAVTRA